MPGIGLCLVKGRRGGPAVRAGGCATNREQLVLHEASPSQVKGWERQRPAALGAAKAPARAANVTRARLSTITTVSVLKAPAGSRRQPVPALSQLSTVVGLGSLLPALPFTAPCPPA